MKRNLMLVDGINLILAIALIVSPWVLISFPAGIPTYNAVIAGLAIGAVALGALVVFAQWEEWVNLILGIWVIASPFVLGFASVTMVMWAHVVIGLAVAVLAAVELWTVTSQPPAHTTTS